MNSNPVAEALKAGLKAFGPNGENWVQGTHHEPKCCVVTALRDSEPVTTRVEARILLRNALGALDLADWNDEPGRTFSEVKALYEKAIELAERGE